MPECAGLAGTLPSYPYPEGNRRAMSTPSQVESFCESCGTRYAFEPRRSAKRHLVKVGRLVGILPDEPDVDDSALVVSRDPFHGAFHFCLECRRFTCPTCWDAAAGFCRSCAAVLSGGDDAAEPTYTLDAETEALLRTAWEDLVRLGTGEAWASLEPPPEARPEPAPTTIEMGEAPADDLTSIIEAGVAAMAAKEAQAAREAQEAAEREQARLEQERREQEEAERIAAEQAEAQRLAWEQYEAQRRQYEADLAAWEAAEAQRLAAEAQRLAEEEAQRTAAEDAQRLADEEARQRAAQEAGDQQASAEAAEAERLAAEQEAERRAAEQEAQRRAAEQAEAERLAAQQEAERLALEAERLAAQRAEAERLAQEAEAARATPPADDSVWDTLAGALGPDVAAEEAPAPPPARPEVPPVPQVPPPPPPAAWHVRPPAGGPVWAPPPPPPGPGFLPPAPGWNGNGQLAAPPGHAPLRSGIRPCPRCELALSANARFCRRCGLPQG